MGVYREYFRILDKRRDLFERAFYIAGRVEENARKLFGECEIYLIGSFARCEHKLSSDLDLLVVAPGIPDKLDFDWYSEVVRELAGGEEVNIHLLNPEAFRRLEGMYKDRIRLTSK